MKSLLSLTLALLFALSLNAQTRQTSYYNNQWLEKEVPAEKAKFSKTIIQNADSSITIVVADLKQGGIVSSETYKGNVPYGIWKRRGKEHMEVTYFDFDVVYGKSPCNDSSAIQLKGGFTNIDSLHFVAPTFQDFDDLTDFLSDNLEYPRYARENGIEGQVVVSFVISSAGVIEQITVTQEVNPYLDKEAVRVVRLIQLKTPPMIDGKAIRLCMKLPIRFQLD